MVHQGDLLVNLCWGNNDENMNYVYSYYVLNNNIETLLNYITYNIPNKLIENKKIKIQIYRILNVIDNNYILKKILYERTVDYDFKESLLFLLNDIGREINNL